MEIMDNSYNVSTLPAVRSNRQNAIYRRRNLTPDFMSSKSKILTKQIKNNETAIILGGSPIKWDGQKEELVVIYAEKKEVVNNIVNVRKKLDETREMIFKIEAETYKMKDDIEKMRINEELMGETSSKTQQQYDNLKASFGGQTTKLEEALITKKAYEGMLERLRKDLVVDRLRYAHLEKTLGGKLKDLNLEADSVKKTMQFKVQAQNVLGDMIKQVENEDKLRHTNLFQFGKAVISKEEAEKEREVRLKKTENLAEVVAKEVVLTNEKEYRSLYLVHKFVHLFFKKKMEKEMRNHERVEQAFQRIRAAVGVTDAQQIVDRFTKREETYSSMLASIANYEKKVAETKIVNSQLSAKLHALKERYHVPQQGKNLVPAKLDDEIENQNRMTRKHYDIVEASKIAKLKLEQTQEWAVRMLQRIDKARQGERADYEQLIPRNNIGVAVLKVITEVKKYIKSTNEKECVKVLDEIDRANIGEELENRDFLSRNLRVKANEGPHEGRADSTSRTSRTQSRGHSPWDMDKSRTEEKDEDDVHFETVLQTRRKEIRAKLAQARVEKRIAEKEAR